VAVWAAFAWIASMPLGSGLAAAAPSSSGLSGRAGNVPWTDADLHDAARDPKGGGALVRAVLANAERANALALMTAAGSAHRLGRLEDAGFLFYAGRSRALLDLYAYPDDTGSANPALAAISLQVKSTLLPEIIGNPRASAAIARRYDAWPIVPPSGYDPGWQYDEAKPADEIRSRAEEIRALQSKMLHNIATLLTISEYREAIGVLQRDGARASQSTLANRQAALATLQRIEEERGLQYVTARQESPLETAAKGDDRVFIEKRGPTLCNIPLASTAVGPAQLAMFRSCPGVVMGKPDALKVKQLATGEDRIEPRYGPLSDSMLLGFDPSGVLLWASTQGGEDVAAPRSLVVESLTPASAAPEIATRMDLGEPGMIRSAKAGDACWLMGVVRQWRAPRTAPGEPNGMFVLLSQGRLRSLGPAINAWVQFWDPVARVFVVRQSEGNAPATWQTVDCAGTVGKLRPGLSQALSTQFTRHFPYFTFPGAGPWIQLEVPEGEPDKGRSRRVLFDLLADKVASPPFDDLDMQQVIGMTATRDGTKVAFAVRDGLAVYAIDKRQRLRTIPMEYSSMRFEEMAFTPDGAMLVVWSREGFATYTLD